MANPVFALTTLPNLNATEDGQAYSEEWFNQLTEFFEVVNNYSMMVGTGSPEGVVDALQGRLYTDTSAGAGALLYVKRDIDDGAGDTRFGWILV